MDRISRARRSWNMSRIRNCDTAPERAVRSLLHSMGYRFRLHSKTLPGHPDIVLPRYQTVIMVHGCFWHRHSGCRYAYTPKTRTEFWIGKFDANIRRDAQVNEQLTEHGWRVIVVWECELKDEQSLATRLISEFDQQTEKTVTANREGDHGEEQEDT